MSSMISNALGWVELDSQIRKSPVLDALSYLIGSWHVWSLELQQKECLRITKAIHKNLYPAPEIIPAM